MDATHEKILKLHDKMDQMTKELQCMRKDSINKVEKSVSMLMKIALRNEAENQLPRVALLTKFCPSKLEKILTKVPRVLGHKFVKIQLYYEDKKLPHPVENQPGITLTSLSEFQLEYLDKALPYINGLFHILNLAATLGISPIIVPLASSLIPNWTPHLKLAK